MPQSVVELGGGLAVIFVLYHLEFISFWFKNTSADESQDSFLVIAFAPKGMKDVDCKAWVTAATEGTGGKGGGKGDGQRNCIVDRGR